MNDKITMPKLVAMLAIATGKQKNLCEDFLKELFSIVEEELLKGEGVRIKGFGTFKLVDVEPRKSVNVATGEETLIPGHSRVLFVAAKELAARVNLPFEAFEAVEIADGLPTDSMDGDEIPDCGFPSEGGDRAEELPDNPDPETVVGNNECEECAEMEEDVDLTQVSESESVEESPETVAASSETVEESLESEHSQETEESPDPEHSQESGELCECPEIKEESLVGQECLPEHEEGDKELYENNGEHKVKKHGHKYVKGFVAGFATALVVGSIAFAIGYLSGFSFGLTKGEEVAESAGEDIAEAVVKSEDSTLVDQQVALESDSAAQYEPNKDSASDRVPTQPSDEPVYDTVSTTRYLTTIAQEHYGNFNLWPIIYEENESILGHPDRIRPGTKVVVPPLSKYGIDPSDKAQIRAIKEKGNKIYAKFK